VARATRGSQSRSARTKAGNAETGEPSATAPDETAEQNAAEVTVERPDTGSEDLSEAAATGSEDVAAPQPAEVTHDPDAVTDTPDPLPVSEVPATEDAQTAQAAPEQEPMPEPEAGTAPAAPPPPPPRRGGFVAPVLGGMLAAAIGFGAAIWFFPDGWRGSQRADMVGAQIADMVANAQRQSARIAALEGRVAGLSAPPDVTGDLAAMAERLAAAEAALAAAETPVLDVTPLEARIAALEAVAPADAGTLAAETATLASEIAALRAEQAALSASLAAEVEAAEAAEARISEAAETAAARAVAGVEERLRAAEARAETAASEAAAEAEAQMREAAGSAALARLAAALQTGAPIGPAVDDLRAAGRDVPDALAAQSGGLPTVATLQDTFAPAARGALAAVRRDAVAADEPLADRLGGFLRTQLGVRSLAAREGDDPDAVLSRAEAALETGDVGAALDELAALPPSGREAMSGWLAGAEARVAAEQALAALRSDTGSEPPSDPEALPDPAAPETE